MPRQSVYCYTYAYSTNLLKLASVYITGTRGGHSFAAAPEPTREAYRVNGKRKRGLTKNQERRRTEGLRILARIIARHYLANPHLYRNGSTPADGQATGDGETDRKGGAA